jgi:hypothetical protein
LRSRKETWIALPGEITAVQISGITERLSGDRQPVRG